MELSSGIFIKNEKDLLAIQENLDFNFDVKIEEIPIIGDLPVSNGDTLKKYECRVKNEVSCDKLKDGYLQNCCRCFLWFPDSYELIKHNIIHLKIKIEKLTLPKIQQVKTKRGAIRKKIENKNAENNAVSRYKCAKCDSNFKRIKDLSKHVRYIHEPKEVACDVCLTKLTNKDALKTHKRNCHTEHVYCDICDSKLKSSSYLHAHMRRVHYDDGKVHSCDICNKIFKSPRYLRIHRKNSHKVAFNTIKVIEKKNSDEREVKQIKLEPEYIELDTTDQVSTNIRFEEPILYEIEVPYEIALS